MSVVLPLPNGVLVTRRSLGAIKTRLARSRAAAALLPRVLAQLRRGELGRAKQQQDRSRQRQPPRPGIAVGVKD